MVALKKTKNSDVTPSVLERDRHIASRLDDLKEFASDEGEILNANSITDFLKVMNDNPSFRAPYIFSNDAGNISITWKNERSRLSLVFYGEKKAELTHFVGITKETIPLPHVLETTLETIIPVVRNFHGLERVLFLIVDNRNKDILVKNEIEIMLREEYNNKVALKIQKKTQALELRKMVIHSEHLIKIAKIQEHLFELESVFEKNIQNIFFDSASLFDKNYYESINKYDEMANNSNISKKILTILKKSAEDTYEAGLINLGNLVETSLKNRFEKISSLLKDIDNVKI
jgi:hypothetical protein